MVNIPYGNAGIASFEQGAAYGSVELFSGSTPLPTTEDFAVQAGVALPVFSVVGLSGGYLVLAKDDKSVQAIGVTTAPVGAGATDQSIAIYRAGCFNPAALNWDASYTTDAKKAAAFRAAPTPTDILIRKFL